MFQMGELERDVKKELEDNSKGKTHDINGDDQKPLIND